MSEIATVQNGEVGLKTISTGFNYDAKIATLSEDERTKLLDLTNKVNMEDMTSVQNYGSELNQVIDKVSDELLKSVRADNNGEVNDLMAQLTAELNLIDLDDLKSETKFKRFLRRVPLLKRAVTSVETALIKYESISENVNRISQKIYTAKVIANRDNTTLDGIFRNDKMYVQKIRDYIIGMKLRLGKLEDEIKEKQEDINTDAITLHTYQQFKNNIERRIADMLVMESVLTTNMYHVKTLQQNNVLISNKSDYIVTNMVPIWKHALAMSAIMSNQEASIKAQSEVTKTTNKLFEVNAQRLHKATVEVARSNEESVISLQTLQTTTEELISTINEVNQIQIEGAKRRKETEQVLQASAQKLMAAVQSASTLTE